MENLFSLRSSQFCERYEALKGEAERDEGRNDRETLLDSRLQRRFFFCIECPNIVSEKKLPLQSWRSKLLRLKRSYSTTNVNISLLHWESLKTKI